MADEELNLYDVPLVALRPSTRLIIVNELNKKKVLASEEGLPRDWRGLAHLAGQSQPAGDNPASQVLAAWERHPATSLGQLLQFLGQIDRWDIVDDVTHMISDDAKSFLTQSTNKSSLEESQLGDNQILTFDDISALEHGLELQTYDALLLYDDQDQLFAKQMLERLENEYFLKVCLKEQLVGGLSSEHHGVLRLINERCRHVIIIVSRHFVNSPVNRFFVMFSHSLAIERCRRIIIPIMYERDRSDLDKFLPIEIKMLVKLDYYRVGLRNYDFWGQLRDSVSVRTPAVVIREISDRAEQLQLPAAKPIKSNKSKKGAEDKAQLWKSTSNLNGPAENICSGSPLPLLPHKFSCSTLSIPEKKHKSRSPKAILRKLFSSDSSKVGTKSGKIAVRL